MFAAVAFWPVLLCYLVLAEIAIYDKINGTDARRLTMLCKDLAWFLDAVLGTLGNSRRQRCCETYVRGVLLGAAHAKNIEPIATRLQKIESGAEGYEQAVRDGLQRWIDRGFGMSRYIILDVTGFPKLGTHSVGVARQYTATLGKVASCQVAVR